MQLFASFLVSIALAANAPDFPSCTSPSGEIKVEYVSGQHAIVGESVLREGSDKVYSLFDGNTLQCFCPENGQGIQTNWWKFGQLSQEQIDSLKVQGWHFVPDGTDWGLTADPYLAKNEDYDCKPNGAGDPPSRGQGGGDVLSSLAPTGDNTRYIGLVSLGVALVAVGLLLKKHGA